MLPGPAAVVPEGELFQIGLEISPFNPVVMGPTESGLEVSDDPVHPREDFGGSRGIPWTLGRC